MKVPVGAWYGSRVTEAELAMEHAALVARTCQRCGGMGGHGDHSSKGTSREFWQTCSACNGTGRREAADEQAG